MTTSPDQEPQVSTLAPQDRIRLYRVLGKMPYAAGLSVRSLEHLTIASLAETLEKLTVCLAEHATRCEARDAKLREHEALLRGGRRFLAAMLPALGDEPRCQDPECGEPLRLIEIGAVGHCGRTCSAQG